MTFHRLLDRIDSGLAREDQTDAETVALQTFATVWAALGYVIWIALLLTARVVVAVARALASPWRRRRARPWKVTARREEERLD